MAGSRIVTVKKIIPLFKGDVQANKIALIELKEVGNLIVSGIEMYKEGDKAIFIEPDYCLPDTSLFAEYYRPNGEASKCKLGSNGRIRAIKFNLHIGDGMPVYSYGVLIPLTNNLKDFITESHDISTLDKVLGITKSDDSDEGFLPSGMYKTDEVNINNFWNIISYPITLIGTEKVDGQSITLYYKKGKAGICSRRFEIPLFETKIAGRRKKTFTDVVQKVFTGKYPNLNIYKEVKSTNDYIKVGEPYLIKLIDYCESRNIALALRGEFNGKGLRGSGNKNNPAAKKEPNIKFYAVDDYAYPVTEILPEEDFNYIINELGFERCQKYFTRKMRCKKDIINICEKIFAKEEAQGNIIEGIVLKTPDGKFSTKYMNLKYDSKK